MEQLPTSSPWYPFVSIDPDRLGGVPVFRGTRVPVQALFDYIKAGYDLKTFHEHFHGIAPDLVNGVLDLVAQGVPQGRLAA